MNHLRRLPLLPAAILVLSLTACGPHVSLDAGIASEATTILLGTPKPPPADPLAPARLPIPSYPGLVTGAVPITPPPVVVPPVVVPPVPARACPGLSNTTFPKVGAGASIAKAPTAGAYAYRQEGSSIADSNPAVRLPAADTHIVTLVPASAPATISYTVQSTTYGGAKVETTYSVVPPPTDQSATVPGTIATGPVTVQASGGLYITKIVTTDHGNTQVFAPAGVGYQVFQEPASIGATFTSSAVDPNSQVSVDLQGSVVGHALANACGQAVDGWKITLAETVLGASENITDNETIIVSPQYGGLITDQVSHMTGTYASHNVTQQAHTTISVVPGTHP